MSLEKICPHNSEIVCDYGYCNRELARQRKVAFEVKGAKVFSYTVSMSECMAKYQDCPRYLAAMQSQQKQR
ncbi:MAG: hypothetical protein R8M37_02230 [Alphaproteobacteria bacterium]|nr:hypothetical protein [Alphaproteobacteria bacterium]